MPAQHWHQCQVQQGDQDPARSPSLRKVRCSGHLQPQMSERIRAEGSRGAAVLGQGWITMQGTDRARAGH